MKIKNTVLTILSVSLVACLSLGISACDFRAIPKKKKAKVEYSEGLEFQLNEEGDSYIVTGIGDCTDTDVVIPSTYEKMPVTVIGEEAFFDCVDLTSVVIPDSVVTIGDGAFYFCESLNSVEMGDSVAVIGDWAFSNCTNLANVEIVDSVIVVGDWAFSDCANLTSVEIGEGVTIIGELAFSNCESLTEIKVAKNNVKYKDVDGNLYSKDGTIFIQYATGKQQTVFTLSEEVFVVGAWAFDHCFYLTNVEIGENVETIEQSAFFHCTNLARVVIPDGVMTIGDSAFFDCSNLSSVVIGKEVLSIGSSAFGHCYSLINVVIGASVISIEDDAFYDCESLENVYYQGSEVEWNSVEIGDENEYLTNATIYYYSESVPTGSGNYWRYNGDGEVEIWE